MVEEESAALGVAAHRADETDALGVADLGGGGGAAELGLALLEHMVAAGARERALVPGVAADTHVERLGWTIK